MFRTFAIPFLLCAHLHAQVAVKADLLFAMTGDFKPIKNAIVLCDAKGRIEKVGPAREIEIPADYQVLTAAVVTPASSMPAARSGFQGS